MSYGHKVQKVMVQPINLVFRFFQKKIRVQIWIYDVVNLRLEGRAEKKTDKDSFRCHCRLWRVHEPGSGRRWRNARQNSLQTKHRTHPSQGRQHHSHPTGASINPLPRNASIMKQKQPFLTVVSRPVLPFYGGKKLSFCSLTLLQIKMKKSLFEGE